MMKIKFPDSIEASVNPRLASYVFRKAQKEHKEGCPDETIYEHVEQCIYDIIKDEYFLLKVKNIVEVAEYARWIAAGFICTMELAAKAVTYNEVVEAIRKGEDLKDIEKVPLLIIMLPELVMNAEWASAKLMDLLLRRKYFVMITTDTLLMRAAIGDAAANFISEKAEGIFEV